MKCWLTQLSGRDIIFKLTLCSTQHLRSWRNWQTRWIQVPVVAIPWRFESSRPHHTFNLTLLRKGFLFFEEFGFRVLPTGDPSRELSFSIQTSVDSSISKTVNCPADFTVEETKELYELAFDAVIDICLFFRNQSIFATAKAVRKK